MIQENVGWCSKTTNIGFDAARCSPVYGKSDTVQPAAVTVNYYIQMYNSSVPLSQANHNLLAEQLPFKLNADLSNLNPGIDFVIDYKYESNEENKWYKIYRSGWCEQGGECPTNTSSGTIEFLKKFKNTNYTLIVSDHIIESSDTGGVDASSMSYNKTEETFKYSQASNRSTNWYACRYA